MRNDGRQKNQLRKVKITPHVSESAEGSALVEFGKTRLICTASYEAKAPSWLLGTGQGWVTAEYGMLPRSTHQRIKREKASTGGRVHEISRLIGRSLRASVNLAGLGERQIIIDCDVINADGGTRTAAVTGGFVALVLALKKLHDVAEIKTIPVLRYVSAISVGLQGDDMLLDLDYDEDSSIGTDMNFVMTNEGTFVEVQGTAEGIPFHKDHLFQMMDLARVGCEQLFQTQAEVIGNIFPLKK